MGKKKNEKKNRKRRKGIGTENNKSELFPEILSVSCPTYRRDY